MIEQFDARDVQALLHAAVELWQNTDPVEALTYLSSRQGELLRRLCSELPPQTS